jgi:predicted aspartyl protease
VLPSASLNWSRRGRRFGLADGTVIHRSVSECEFEIGGQTAVSPAVLGERDDDPLLGAVTLETLGLVLNPLTRELRHRPARRFHPTRGVPTRPPGSGR